MVEQRLLEAVKRPLPEDDGRCRRGDASRARQAARSRSGPGLGRSDEHAGSSSGGCSSELELPVVVDADALWELEPFDGRGADAS